MHYSVVPGQSLTPVILPGDVKEWERVDEIAEDAWIADRIEEATEHLEAWMWVSIQPKQYEMKLDAFASQLCVPLSPVVSIDSITYVDADGAQQVLDAADYQHGTGDDTRLMPAYGKTWPTTRSVMNAVTILFTSGMATVPQVIKSAIARMVAHVYVMREPEIRDGAKYHELSEVQNVVTLFGRRGL